MLLGFQNLFNLFWFVLTFSVMIVGIITIYFDQYLPLIISDLYKFGKLLHGSAIEKKESDRSEERQSIINYIQLPKRYFLHFYVFAIIYNLIIVSLIVLTDCMSSANDCQPVNIALRVILNREIKIDRTALNYTLMAAIIVQICRRLYECIYVIICVNSKINVMHYFTGFAFYASCGLALIDSLNGSVNHNKLPNNWHLFAFFVFLLASKLQYESHKILYNLRANAITVAEKYTAANSHSIPFGGVFEYVSCPHYLSEIIIYLCIYVMSDGNDSFGLLLLWVIISQTIAAILTHRWYHSRFLDKYPKSRKAIIPYLV